MRARRERHERRRSQAGGLAFIENSLSGAVAFAVGRIILQSRAARPERSARFDVAVEGR